MVRVVLLGIAAAIPVRPAVPAPTGLTMPVPVGLVLPVPPRLVVPVPLAFLIIIPPDQLVIRGVFAVADHLVLNGNLTVTAGHGVRTVPLCLVEVLIHPLLTHVCVTRGTTRGGAPPTRATCRALSPSCQSSLDWLRATQSLVSVCSCVRRSKPLRHVRRDNASTMRRASHWCRGSATRMKMRLQHVEPLQPVDPFKRKPFHLSMHRQAHPW